MRELKFRAWLPEEETMLHSDRQHEIDDFMEVWSIGNTITVEIQELYWHSPGGNTPEECYKYVTPPQVIMQYTGLKDKNGKEIYEGDIFIGDESGDAIVIYWNEEKAAFGVNLYGYNSHTGEGGQEVDDSDKSLIDVDFMEVYSLIDFEVVGNIYEHPELLH
jgi:uncharacterized phage protein (TIGR01671 family)